MYCRIVGLDGLEFLFLRNGKVKVDAEKAINIASGPNSIAQLLDLIVVVLHVSQVADLIPIRFVLEVVLHGLGSILPHATHFLHYEESLHALVLFNQFLSCLKAFLSVRLLPKSF